jgi:hypothetical protein
MRIYYTKLITVHYYKHKFSEMEVPKIAVYEFESHRD